ncbi:hypothetical protein [Tautonia sociabilis]|uniref:Uncharacterized protein n=1 Tax=Tautonia sociabilis TaxID=2080755 RepID=A0A432ME77_9BACT|nr:hypothetical protein [Tautonia sociabilis]RUL83508.1 hypothetical protein TsocGM_22065 [Tautonia sociabilis]
MIHDKTQVDVASNADPFAWGTPSPGAGRARRRAERVKAGDYRAVLAELDRPSFDPIEQERHWLDVGEALRVSSHADPGAFALAQLDEMVEFLAYLRLRAETSLRRR